MNAVVDEKDPLEGFRELTEEQLEAGLRKRLGANADMVDVWQMGVEMQAYADTPAGALLIKTLRDELHENLLALLEQADPGTELSRRYFFEARTRYMALELIQSTISKGMESEKAIIQADQ